MAFLPDPEVLKPLSAIRLGHNSGLRPFIQRRLQVLLNRPRYLLTPLGHCHLAELITRYAHPLGYFIKVFGLMWLRVIDWRLGPGRLSLFLHGLALPWIRVEKLRPVLL